MASNPEGERARGHARPGALIGAFAVLLVLPTANIAWFAGMPFRTPAAFFAAAAVVPYAFSSRLRAAHWTALLRGGRRLPAVVGVAVVAAAVCKVVLLLAPGASAGFTACYRSLTAHGPPGCERSFAFPFSGSNLTRKDETIDFGTRQLPNDFWNAFGLFGAIQLTNWDLGFLNSNRYDFLPGLSVDPLRHLFPGFTVRWSGRVSVRAAGTSLSVTYLGEGQLSAAGHTTQFATAYTGPGTAQVALGPGTQAVTVGFTYQPASPLDTSQGRPEFHVLQADGAPLRPSGPGWPWRAPAVFSDLVTALVAASLGGMLLLSLGRMRVAAVGAACVAPPLALGVALHGPTATAVAFLILVICLLVGSLVLGRHATDLEFGLAAYLSVLAVETDRALATFGTLSLVQYRGTGEDALTYESLARSILETGSLRGGENVYVYSPASRYLLFLEHLIFGDGNVTIGVTMIVALTVAVFLLARQLERRVPRLAGRRGRYGMAAVLAIALGLGLMLESVGVVLAASGFSEAPAWILVLVTLYCLMRPPSERAATIGVLCAALAFTFRFEEAPGLTLMAGACLWRWARVSAQPRRRKLWAGAGLAAAGVLVASLPALHNLYYGHRLQFLLATPNVPVNFPIPVAKILSVPASAHLRAIFFSQLRGVLDVGPPDTVQYSLLSTFKAGIRILQVAWVVAVGWALARRVHLRPLTWVFLVLPLAFLLPHLFVQVFNLYPRHIIAGYLAMAAGAGWGLADLIEAATAAI